jgi:hypothetical protein
MNSFEPYDRANATTGVLLHDAVSKLTGVKKVVLKGDRGIKVGSGISDGTFTMAP